MATRDARVVDVHLEARIARAERLPPKEGSQGWFASMQATRPRTVLRVESLRRHEGRAGEARRVAIVAVVSQLDVPRAGRAAVDEAKRVAVTVSVGVEMKAITEPLVDQTVAVFVHGVASLERAGPPSGIAVVAVEATTCRMFEAVLVEIAGCRVPSRRITVWRVDGECVPRWTYVEGRRAVRQRARREERDHRHDSTAHLLIHLRLVARWRLTVDGTGPLVTCRSRRASEHCGRSGRGSSPTRRTTYRKEAPPPRSSPANA